MWYKVNEAVGIILLIAVVGGGCSGFSYSMAFENQPNMLDKTYQYDGLKVFVDQASLLYLDGAEVDYVEDQHSVRLGAVRIEGVRLIDNVRL